MKSIDVNVDIGEGFPHDRELLKFASSANVCCGHHAGCFELTVETIHRCIEAGVRVGMHPGFPDRVSMGRRFPTPDVRDLWYGSLSVQVNQFLAVHKAAYVKPHGALYTMVSRLGHYEKKVEHHMHLEASRELGMAIRAKGLALMIQAEADLEELQTFADDVKVIHEEFAERRYDSDGWLRSRSEPDSLLTDADEIQEQVLRLAPNCDSLCIHGDSPDCVWTLELVVKTLRDAGYEVSA